MATHRPSMIGFGTVPDDSDNVFPAPIDTQITVTGAEGDDIVFVMPDPNGGGDHGIKGRYRIPKNYAGTPKVVVRYILDGTPAATANVNLGIKMLGRADNEGYDNALGTEATSVKNVGSGGGAYTDEDVVEQEITITETIAIDDDVWFFFYIDDSGTNPYTGTILLTDLIFQYSDT